MRTQLLIAALLAAPAAAFAAGVEGAWKTEKNDAGGYLVVTMAPCASDPGKICGTISKAFKASGEDGAYPHLGRLIVKDMMPDGDSRWSDGTVWDPESGKTYSSHMSLKSGTLDLEGCVSIFCEGQDWVRAE